MRRFVFFLICFVICTAVFAADDVPQKQTFIYAVKGIDTLRLDKYDLSPQVGASKPCIVFMFGGSFMRGNRDHQTYMAYFKRLAELGYIVISIDYRLGLKGVQDRINMKQSKLKLFNAFVENMTNAVNMAVEDLFDATSFIIEHSSAWGADTAAVVLSGSSAGAISVLNGEYALCNAMPSASKLPAGFRYAGVISFAGAIFST
ncbi:MAG: alpha/beta hydrolase, partial [Tannerella sp.]|nr:alpha/beta hydrolase [Tannerella sp.]